LTLISIFFKFSKLYLLRFQMEKSGYWGRQSTVCRVVIGRDML